MRQTIHILPEHLASKIAAGEVVQRPASVVKELFENSIDAGATAIKVLIKDGGKTLIQVVDDGQGMSMEDARLAFNRHATSKIATYDDLENIRTLGFRGEALASIAAVAHVELRTRLQGDPVGTKVRIEGGEIQEHTQDAWERGTSVTVRNLFYNTPARRNFLKSNTAEFKHVFDVIQRIALAHPEFKITFVSDDDTVLDLLPTTLHERMIDLFGEHRVQGLIPVEETRETISVKGYTSKPDYARNTRVEQYLFLNGRYIVSRNLNFAVYQAYEHLLEKGSFPFFVLFLTIDPRRVDVNVHPSKMEVKFEDERAVYRLLMNAVRKALMAHDLAPTIEHRRTEEMRIDGKGLSQPGSDAWRSLFQPEAIQQRVPSSEPLDRPSPESLSSIQNNESRQVQFSPRQVHNKYIVTSTPEGLMIVDQHAAHERILYERIVGRLNSARPVSQQLLFSQTVDLTPGDAALVKQLESDLAAMGFVLKFFGKNTVVLEAMPPEVPPGKETTILQDMLDLYKENEHDVRLKPRENLAKAYSCKAAIKAGDSMSEEEMRSLLEQLFTTNNPFVCPHGRPAIVKLSLAELDKRFGRPVNT